MLDAGGQYCHLIARKVRELGVGSEVFPSEALASELARFRGVIISGGPSSVYDHSSPTVQTDVLTRGVPVLGICYGQQLITHLLGGEVRKGDRGEFGLATLQLVSSSSVILQGVPDQDQVWMSHRDLVVSPPAGFQVVGRTSTCPVAAIEDAERKLFGVQFHPEVIHTAHGQDILKNFVLNICGCEKNWNPAGRLDAVEDQIRRVAGDRNIFFFVSGGVDSTVAFTLCLRALGSERVRGVYVDTGLMREGETEFVERTFERLGHGVVDIEHAEAQFLTPLAQVRDPELKRHIIGEQFVQVQERIIESRGLLDGHWILGQGTIYPDTVESGGSGSGKTATIKTHHNRVAGIQKLMEAGRIIEPLSDFYKDEVRDIGRRLQLPTELLDRHPFPGPGLAIRCLCSPADEAISRVPEGYLVPVRSVGVQGDSRTYAPVLAIDTFPSSAARLQDEATELINRHAMVNRVIARVAQRENWDAQQVFASTLTQGRVNLLRRADAIIRAMSASAGYDGSVWQFPVILIPLGTPEARDSIVLRPIDSVDGMTAESVNIPDQLLHHMAERILQIPEIAGVYLDLTHKPPGTIEWE